MHHESQPYRVDPANGNGTFPPARPQRWPAFRMQQLDTLRRASSQLLRAGRAARDMAPVQSLNREGSSWPGLHTTSPRYILRQRLRQFLQTTEMARHRVHAYLHYRETQFNLLGHVEAHGWNSPRVQQAAHRFSMQCEREIRDVRTFLHRIDHAVELVQKERERNHRPGLTISIGTLSRRVRALGSMQRKVNTGVDALAALYARESRAAEPEGVGAGSFTSFLDFARLYLNRDENAWSPLRTCDMAIPAQRGELENTGVLPRAMNNHVDASRNASPRMQAEIFARATPIDTDVNHRRYTFSNGDRIDIQAHVAKIGGYVDTPYLWQGYTASFYGKGTDAPWDVQYWYGWEWAAKGNGLLRHLQTARPAPNQCNLASRAHRYEWSRWRSENAPTREAEPLTLPAPLRRPRAVEPTPQHLAGQLIQAQAMLPCCTPASAEVGTHAIARPTHGPDHPTDPFTLATPLTTPHPGLS